MASFFNSIGSGITNTFNTAINGIGSGVNYVSNSGIGHFFGSVLNSGSTFLQGIANVPNDLGNLVNSISNNSTLFFWGIILVAGFMIINDFKEGSSSSGSYYSSGRYG